MNFKREVELVIDGQRFGFAGVQPVRTASDRITHATALVGRCADCGRPFAQSVRATSLLAVNIVRRCAEHRKNGVRVATINLSALRQPPAFTAAMAAMLSPGAEREAAGDPHPKARSRYGNQLSASEILVSNPAATIIGRSVTKRRDISAKDLLDALLDGWMPVPLLGVRLGVSERSVSTMLRRALQLGLIERNTAHTYRLTAAWRPVTQPTAGGQEQHADGQDGAASAADPVSQGVGGGDASAGLRGLQASAGGST